jgi:hypothetical protein
MLLMKPVIEMSDVNELGEPLLDVYGTPWGRCSAASTPTFSSSPAR